MKEMKVLMLGWELPPHNSGGLGVACWNLAKALVAEGAKIDFVLPYADKDREINFMRVLSAIDEGHKNETLGAYDDLTWDMRLVQQKYGEFVRKYLQENQPDVIHVHDWLTMEAGIIAKELTGAPLVVHIHATEYDRSGMQFGNELIHSIEKNGLRLAEKVVVVSKNTKNLIHEKYGVALEKIVVVYNAIDDNFLRDLEKVKLDDFAYFDKLKEAGYAIVSTVGRFTVQKGLLNMLYAAEKALKKYPKLVFVLAGDGEQKDELISLSSELGIAKNIIFTGFVRGKKLQDIYNVSDIFVMSSISEPFGLTALEAAHHKNALILTNQSGVSEVLKSGMKYDFWDIDKLAEQIVAMAENVPLRSAVQDKIYAEYRKFSWEDAAQKCMTIYKSLQ